MSWHVGGKTLKSRFFLGTAAYPSPDIMARAVRAAEAEVITVALRRQMPGLQTPNYFWQMIRQTACIVLPNTAGCHTVDEAVVTAHMARELFGTHWIKLEVTGDDYNLQPDPFALVEAAKILIADGFEVFPYCTDDLVLCKRLMEVGCRILMPWGAPIGSGQGLLNPYALRTLRQRLPQATLLVDAGIGSPADAIQAMQLGYDGVLLNSAVAQAHDPVKMAAAFKLAVRAGRLAYEAGMMLAQDTAVPSTPVVGTPFWHQEAAHE